MQKSILVLIASLLIAALIVFIIFFAWQYFVGKMFDPKEPVITETSNVQNQEQIKDETADWKTFYYNQYEFRYPSTWNLWMTLESEVPGGCFSQGDSVCAYSYGGAFSVNVLPWNENTCKQYWNGVGGPKATLQEIKIINGKQFYYGRFEEDNLEIYHIFYNKSCYELAATIIGKPDLDKILATFKFTK